jgi:uncharacterized membrane protein YidH (DUF202 family)
MKIAAGVAKVLFLLLLLYLGCAILEDRYEGSFGPLDSYPYSKGNAPEEVRSEILATLTAFQDGYERRDVEQVQPFMQKLFSPDNVLILGTMPSEIFAGFDEATRLVRGDWAGWGDCSFAIDNTHVSAHGEVAWFSTIGYVEFDLSELLVLPLRLSGVLVREAGVWRFQQLQFQFDLDLGYLIVINLLLAVGLAVSTVSLAISVVRTARTARTALRSRDESL